MFFTGLGPISLCLRRRRTCHGPSALKIDRQTCLKRCWECQTQHRHLENEWRCGDVQRVPSFCHSLLLGLGGYAPAVVKKATAVIVRGVVSLKADGVVPRVHARPRNVPQRLHTCSATNSVFRNQDAFGGLSEMHACEPPEDCACLLQSKECPDLLYASWHMQLNSSKGG